MENAILLRYPLPRNDDDHMQRFYIMLDEVCVDLDVVERIEMTAKVVARLYRLQLEELDDE